MNNRLIPLPALILVAVIVISGIVSTQSCASAATAVCAFERAEPVQRLNRDLLHTRGE